MIGGLQSKFERKEWCDIVKAELIIWVILGHSYLWFNGIANWFHMPLFFIISGYLLKLPTTDYRVWIKRKAKRLLIPWIFFTILWWFSNGDIRIESFLRMAFYNFIYGGRNVRAYGVSWFATCLFLSLVVFSFIECKIKGKNKKIVLYSLFFCLAYLETYTVIPYDYIPHDFCFPWNADVCLMAVPYVAVGYYGKGIVDRIYCFMKNSKLIIITVNVGFSAVILIGCLAYYYGHYDMFVMKYSRYAYPIDAILIPVAAGYILLLLSVIFEKLKCVYILKKYLIRIGQSSYYIMWTHILVREHIMIPIFGETYSVLLWILLSSICGVLCLYISTLMSARLAPP